MDTIYAAMRAEIVTNHVLLHITTFAVMLVLLTGAFVTERRDTILSVLLPLVSLMWASATLRFDFFIHRQGAYLAQLEPRLLADPALRAAPPPDFTGTIFRASALRPASRGISEKRTSGDRRGFLRVADDLPAGRFARFRVLGVACS